MSVKKKKNFKLYIYIQGDSEKMGPIKIKTNMHKIYFSLHKIYDCSIYTARKG